MGRTGWSGRVSNRAVTSQASGNVLGGLSLRHFPELFKVRQRGWGLTSLCWPVIGLGLPPCEGQNLGQCSSLKPKVIPVRVTIICYQQPMFPEAGTKATWP